MKGKIRGEWRGGGRWGFHKLRHGFEAYLNRMKQARQTTHNLQEAAYNTYKFVKILAKVYFIQRIWTHSQTFECMSENTSFM